jgi:hypothetical protein
MLNKELVTLIVTPEVVNELLKKRIFEHTEKETKEKQVGVVTGLAYTQYGGDILPIEVNHFPGKGGLVLTGKLGDVLSFGIPKEVFETNDVHIHVPEGAVPKDGPSAGVTITTAIVSALTNIPVPQNLGMTGEITLRGLVFPIGGLREKSTSVRITTNQDWWNYWAVTLIGPKWNHSENWRNQILSELNFLRATRNWENLNGERRCFVAWQRSPAFSVPQQKIRFLRLIQRFGVEQQFSNFKTSQPRKCTMV